MCIIGCFILQAFHTGTSSNRTDIESAKVGKKWTV